MTEEHITGDDESVMTDPASCSTKLLTATRVALCGTVAE